MTWLIVPYYLAYCTSPAGYNEPFYNFSAITFLKCFKLFCNIYCKCIVCTKVYIKRLCMVFPIMSSWKNYQSSRKKCGSLYPTLPYRHFSQNSNLYKIPIHETILTKLISKKRTPLLQLHAKLQPRF